VADSCEDGTEPSGSQRLSSMELVTALQHKEAVKDRRIPKLLGNHQLVYLCGT
jgi:hypothetical protein